MWSGYYPFYHGICSLLLLNFIHDCNATFITASPCHALCNQTLCSVNYLEASEDLIAPPVCETVSVYRSLSPMIFQLCCVYHPQRLRRRPVGLHPLSQPLADAVYSVVSPRRGHRAPLKLNCSFCRHDSHLVKYNNVNGTSSSRHRGGVRCSVYHGQPQILVGWATVHLAHWAVFS